MSMNRQRSLGLSLLLVAAVDFQISGAVQKCTLKCSNFGVCTLGNATPVVLDGLDTEVMFHTTDNNGQYCLCTDGWTGPLCETVFESCASKRGAGCLNGGDCVKGLVDKYGNPQYMCDCSNATDSKGFPYVGKYCEHPFTQYCDDEKGTFCVNGGDCDLADPVLPCDCKEGFEGIHCEFKTGQVPNCTLNCTNGGECVLGILTPDQANGRYNFFEDDDAQYQRCVCPDNYEGLYCDVQKKPCGDEYCYNGGKCNDDNATCDCTDAPLFEGMYCQLKKTSITPGTSDTTQQVPCGVDQFCFNGGTCNMEMVSGKVKHVCDCTTADKDGFSYNGQYCQYLSPSCDEDCQKNETITSVECGDQFCFNGATCQRRVDSFGVEKHNCKCKTGYAGTYCEYKAAQDCSLECKNGGICVEGGLADADVDDAFNHWNASVNFEHCLCKPDFDGELCEIKHEECGDGLKCENGGSCVKTTINGKARYHCDCSSTLTDEVGYAGRRCEFKSSEICSRDTNNKALLLCVNGGACIGDGYEGCACPPNHTGFSCEFYHGVTSSDTGSTGTTVGTGATASSDKTGNHTVGPPTTATSGGDPTPTTSSGAEPSSAPVGSSSTKSSGAKSNSLIDLCTTGVVPPGEPRFFCINGGACKDYVPAGQPHPGCNCLPGWEGPHCEMRANSNEAPKKALVAVKVLLILISLVLVGVVARYSYKRWTMPRRRFNAEERRRLKDEVNIAPHRESFTYVASKTKSSSSDPIASAMASLPGAPEVYIGPPRDEDGHELHNVEII